MERHSTALLTSLLQITLKNPLSQQALLLNIAVVIKRGRILLQLYVLLYLLASAPPPAPLWSLQTRGSWVVQLLTEVLSRV